MPEELTQPSEHFIKVRVLLFKERAAWSAQGLEYDLTAQGATLEEVKREFERTVIHYFAYCQANGLDMEEEAGRAPDEFFVLWDRLSHPPRGKARVLDTSNPPRYLREALPDGDPLQEMTNVRVLCGQA